MTAEVAIMNKSAVALAADSAVTVQTSSGAKVYNTVNKLFSLSRKAPVAVMIWGGAELCGVPWEVLIKEFRRRLGSSRYDTVADYGDELRSFMIGSSFLTRELQNQDVFSRAHEYFSQWIIDLIERQVHEYFEDHGSITRQKVVRIVNGVLDKELADLESIPLVDGFGTRDAGKVASTYRASIDAAIDSAFEDLPLGEKTRTKIRRLFARFSVKQIQSPRRSGIVVAGFGETDIFPKLLCYEIDGYFLDRPKLIASTVSSIEPDNRAIVIPFAQSEMVFQFMEGVDPVYRSTIQSALEQFARELPVTVADAVGATGQDRARLTGNLAESMDAQIAHFVQRMDTYGEQAHIQPIIEAVAALPKDELGAMAESLVSLTSFKRRVTLDAETVGGAIDVAVVSKGDGFIWLKRKHYFDADRNPQFFSRYSK